MIKNLTKLFFIFLVTISQSSFSHDNEHEQEHHTSCTGWNVEKYCDGYIAQHYHSERYFQIIYITKNKAYYLLPGPYGFEYFFIDLKLPRDFLERCKTRCKWLKISKNGNRLIFTKEPKSPQYLLDFVQVI